MTNLLSKAEALESEDTGSAAAINKILKKYAEDIIPSPSKNFASSNQVVEIKPQTITFYFGDQVIGEVKFHKAGNKEEKIHRCKQMLMKKVRAVDPDSLIGLRLYSPFCKFKII
jgi:hypothetical protein